MKLSVSTTVSNVKKYKNIGGDIHKILIWIKIQKKYEIVRFIYLLNTLSI